MNKSEIPEYDSYDYSDIRNPSNFTYYNKPIDIVADKVSQCLNSAKEQFQNTTKEVDERGMLYLIIFTLIVVIAYMQMNYNYHMYKMMKKYIKNEAL